MESEGGYLGEGELQLIKLGMGGLYIFIYILFI